jgi:hypothetical protein
MKLLEIRKFGCTVAVASLLAASGGALAQGVQNSVNLAVGGLPPFGDTKGTIVMAEYERLLIPKLSVYGRFSALSYKFDDDVDEEEGDGRGLGIGVRFYPQDGMKGFYVGGGIGTYKSKWDWKDDKGKPFQTQGKGETTSVQWGGEVGYRFNLGSERVSLTPALNVGSWLGADDTCTTSTGQTCTKESTVGFYAVISLALGIAF